MTFGNLSELYLTLLGWNFYDSLWQGFSETGLVFVPFLVMVVNHFYEGYRSRHSSGAGDSIRAIETSVAAMLTVVVLAAQPVIAINKGSVTIWITQPASTCSTSTGTGGSGSISTGPSADAVLGSTAATGNGGDVYAPVWWVGAMALSSGLTRGMMGVFDCMTDFREIRQVASTVHIEDPALKAEASQFYNQCYVPARSKFFRPPPKGLSDPQVAQIANQFFQTNAQPTLNSWLADDIAFIGSRVFLGLPGYYDTYRAMSAVDGLTSSSEGVGPTCTNWWDGGAGVAQGLRTRLADQGSGLSSLYNNITSGGGVGFYFENAFNNPSVNEDSIIRRLMRNDPPETGDTGMGEKVASFFKDAPEAIAQAAVFALGGGIGEAASLQTTMYLVREAAPMIQAVTLMAIYAFLPMLLLFPSFGFKALWIGTAAIFTVKFWTVLWAMSRWIDANLTLLMYPDKDHFFTPGPLLESVLLDVISMALYIGLPMFFTIMVGWSGVRLGESMNRSGTELASGATQTGGGMAKKGTSKAGGAK